VNDELGFGRKRWWPNLKYSYGNWLEGLKKIIKKSVGIAGLRAEI
jgi:hypothetical protein